MAFKLTIFNHNDDCWSIFNRKDHTSHTAPIANITENRFGTLISPIEYSSKNGFYEVIEFLPEQIPDTVSASIQEKIRLFMLYENRIYHSHIRNKYIHEINISFGNRIIV